MFYWAFGWLGYHLQGYLSHVFLKAEPLENFLLVTILVPAFATILWFSVFANNAFEISEHSSKTQFNSLYTSLFVF